MVGCGRGGTRTRAPLLAKQAQNQSKLFVCAFGLKFLLGPKLLQNCSGLMILKGAAVFR